MDIKTIVASASEADAKAALDYMLEAYMTPSFGALPKSEVELIMLNVLEKLGAISAEPELYELVAKLKITRSKARRFIYDRDLRRSTAEELDLRIKQLLKRPLIQKNGDLWVLEIENPLVADHLRARLQKLGHVSDGSFSPSIIKLGLDALVALLASYLNKEEQKAVKRALVAAGAPDTSLNGAIKATLKKLASKFAAETGEAVMDRIADVISPLVDAAIEGLTQKAGELFAS